MPAIKHDDLLLRLVKDVNEVRSALRRVVANLPLFDIDNENTPAQLTADQNNYVPGNYDVLRLSGNAARNITGIRNGTKGRRLRIFNVGSYPITLVHASASSLAANRFKFSNAKDAVIPPASTTLIYYDSTQARWIGGDTQSSGAVFMSVTNTGSQGPNTGSQLPLTGTVDSDQYGFWDATNKKIVIQYNGLYQINSTVIWDDGADGTNLFYSYILLNSTIIRYIESTSPADVLLSLGGMELNQFITHTAYFSAGDEIQITYGHGYGPQQMYVTAFYLTLMKIN